MLSAKSQPFCLGFDVLMGTDVEPGSFMSPSYLQAWYKLFVSLASSFLLLQWIEMNSKVTQL